MPGCVVSCEKCPFRSIVLCKIVLLLFSVELSESFSDLQMFSSYVQTVSVRVLLVGVYYTDGFNLSAALLVCLTCVYCCLCSSDQIQKVIAQISVLSCVPLMLLVAVQFRCKFKSLFKAV